MEGEAPAYFIDEWGMEVQQGHHEVGDDGGEVWREADKWTTTTTYSNQENKKDLDVDFNSQTQRRKALELAGYYSTATAPYHDESGQMEQGMMHTGNMYNIEIPAMCWLYLFYDCRRHYLLLGVENSEMIMMITIVDYH